MCGAEGEYTEEGSVTILEIWLPSDYTFIGWLMVLAISARRFSDLLFSFWFTGFVAKGIVCGSTKERCQKDTSRIFRRFFVTNPSLDLREVLRNGN